MEVIKRMEFVVRYRVTCPECLSILEGKPDEFKTETDPGNTWEKFWCPVCKQKREISSYYQPNWCTRVRYKINEDGSIGDEIHD